MIDKTGPQNYYCEHYHYDHWILFSVFFGHYLWWMHLEMVPVSQSQYYGRSGTLSSLIGRCQSTIAFRVLSVVSGVTYFTYCYILHKTRVLLCQHMTDCVTTQVWNCEKTCFLGQILFIPQAISNFRWPGFSTPFIACLQFEAWLHEPYSKWHEGIWESSVIWPEMILLIPNHSRRSREWFGIDKIISAK